MYDTIYASSSVVSTLGWLNTVSVGALSSAATAGPFVANLAGGSGGRSPPLRSNS